MASCTMGNFQYLFSEVVASDWSRVFYNLHCYFPKISKVVLFFTILNPTYHLPDISLHLLLYVIIFLNRVHTSDTTWLVLQYIFLLNGEDLTRLIRDYIKYLFGGKPSIRLKRKMEELHRFYKSLAWKEVKYREDWLEREIIRTPTVWHKPQQLAYLVETYLENYRRQDD